jgi:hypothetical protein
MQFSLLFKHRQSKPVSLYCHYASVILPIAVVLHSPSLLSPHRGLGPTLVLLLLVPNLPLFILSLVTGCCFSWESCIIVMVWKSIHYHALSSLEDSQEILTLYIYLLTIIHNYAALYEPCLSVDAIMLQSKWLCHCLHEIGSHIPISNSPKVPYIQLIIMHAAHDSKYPLKLFL